MGLKKASQFALIWATAADVLPPDGGVGAAVVGAADVDAVTGVLAEALGLALPLLLHAVTAMTAPKANMRKPWRAEIAWSPPLAPAPN